MKYSEAIDMILDGGEAWNDTDESIVYYFHKRAGHFIFSEIDKKQLRRTKDYGYGMEAVLTRKKIEANWIVKKDGVVYEEYYGEWDLLLAPTILLYDEVNDGTCACGKSDGKLYKSIVNQEIFCRPCVLNGVAANRVFNPMRRGDYIVYIKDRVQNQDEPAELEDNGQEWEEIKMPIIADDAAKLKDGEPWMSTEEIREVLESQFPPKPIIADEVNEDWLEKKMLCFMNKYLYPHSGMNLDIKQGQCSNRVCPFCFPQAKPKEDLIKKTIRDMQPVPTAKEASEKAVKNVLEEANKILEQPREKVTVAEILQQVHIIVGCAYVEGMSSNAQDVTYDKKLKAEARNELKQKLEYLVSLQEK